MVMKAKKVKKSRIQEAEELSKQAAEKLAEAKEEEEPTEEEPEETDSDEGEETPEITVQVPVFPTQADINRLVYENNGFLRQLVSALIEK